MIILVFGHTGNVVLKGKASSFNNNNYTGHEVKKEGVLNEVKLLKSIMLITIQNGVCVKK